MRRTVFEGKRRSRYDTGARGGDVVEKEEKGVPGIGGGLEKGVSKGKEEEGK